MRSKHRLIVFLVSAVIFIEKNLTAFLIVAKFNLVKYERNENTWGKEVLKDIPKVQG